MGAADIAGAADDRIEAGGLVKPGLRAVADCGERRFAGQLAQQCRKCRVIRQRQRRIGADRRPLDPKAVGCKGLGLRLYGCEQAGQVDPGYGARLQIQRAAVGDDVDRLSARDHASLQRGIGRLEGRVERTLPQPLRVIDGRAQHIGHGVDGVEPEIGARGMARAAVDGGASGRLALVSAHGAHAAWLADDDAERLRTKFWKAGDQVRHAAASHLLVIGEGEVDRSGEAQSRKRRHCRERRCKKPLHIRGAASVEPFAIPAQRERSRTPLRLAGGNDVHVAGQDVARDIGGANCGEKIGAVAFRPGEQGNLGSLVREIRLNPADDVTVRPAGDRWKGDETVEDIEDVHSSPQGI